MLTRVLSCLLLVSAISMTQRSPAEMFQSAPRQTGPAMVGAHPPARRQPLGSGASFLPSGHWSKVAASLSSAPSSVNTASSIFFEVPSYPSDGYGAHLISLADVNDDGKPDLLVANPCPGLDCYSHGGNNGTVAVLLGNGDGTFQEPGIYSVGFNPTSTAIADVNGDGKADLLVLNLCSDSICSGDGSVSVLLGNGDGTFQAAVGYDSGGSNGTSIAVADVNGDGKPDLLVANGSGVGVLLGNGDGTFQSVVGVSDASASVVVVADVNGDGKPDLLTNGCPSGNTCSNGGVVGVVLGNGNGTFQPEVTYGSGGSAAYSIAVSDVNRDGKLDVLVANGSGVAVLLGNGNGTFQSAVGVSDASGSIVAAADVNGDGKPDLLTNGCPNGNTCSNGGVVGVALGNGDGTFQPEVTYGSGGSSASSLAVADVNGDGKLDVLAGNVGVGVVGVLLGNGDGTFPSEVTYGSGGSYAESVAVADLNGDGKPDWVVANQCEAANCPSELGIVGVSLGNGDGTFRPAVTYSSGGYYAISIAVADVNGDGKPDLLVANQCPMNVNCFESGNTALGVVGVLLGNGDGTFRPVVTYSSGGYYATSIAVADVNGDGKPDLLVSNLCQSSTGCSSTPGTVAVLLGNGDGTFQSAVSYVSGGGGAYSIAVADVNGDGKPDLLVASACQTSSPCGIGSSYGGVGVLLGNGDGTFQSAVSYFSGGETAYSIAVADVNKDGKLDVLVANGCNTDDPDCPNSYGDMGVLLGNGDGTFQSVKTGAYALTALGQGQLAAADFNGDGNVDVVMGSGAVLWLGNGDGTFQVPLGRAVVRGQKDFYASDRSAQQECRAAGFGGY